MEVKDLKVGNTVYVYKSTPYAKGEIFFNEAKVTKVTDAAVYLKGDKVPLMELHPSEDMPTSVVVPGSYNLYVSEDPQYLGKVMPVIKAWHEVFLKSVSKLSPDQKRDVLRFLNGVVPVVKVEHDDFLKAVSNLTCEQEKDTLHFVIGGLR